MSQYYGSESQWSVGGIPISGSGKQGSWDHQNTPPVRSGASSVVARENYVAFASQFEDVERALDNIAKSGKMYAGPSARHGRGPSGHQVSPRSHSLTEYGAPAHALGPGPALHAPNLGPGSGPIPNFTHGPGGPIHHLRSHPLTQGPPNPHPAHGPGLVPATGPTLQHYYASQRHQPSRGTNEGDQMQAKRRMAAQRERELRNFHQEQQYNRIAPSDKAKWTENQVDAVLSPGALSDTRSGPATNAHEGLLSDRARADSNVSPTSNPATKAHLDGATIRTSTSSPGGSPPRHGSAAAPIGTRPTGNPAANSALGKRSTTPLPSPLSHGFNASGNGDEPVGMSSNPPSATAEGYGDGGWGSTSGAWGKKVSGLGVPASVWG